VHVSARKISVCARFDILKIIKIAYNNGSFEYHTFSDKLVLVLEIGFGFDYVC